MLKTAPVHRTLCHQFEILVWCVVSGQQIRIMREVLPIFALHGFLVPQIGFMAEGATITAVSAPSVSNNFKSLIKLYDW